MLAKVGDTDSIPGSIPLDSFFSPYVEMASFNTFSSQCRMGLGLLMQNEGVSDQSGLL